MSVSDVVPGLPGEHAINPQPDPPTQALETDHYTVGWVCALPLEVAAAKGMLDRIHSNLPEQDASDHNNYILGQVQGHNVVIAGLPAGIYGTTPAATVAKDMLRTFKSIRFGLMVGIAGAAPSANHDIRLGDIVVSMPTGTDGGVIQYDRGKAVAGPEFERTGTLKPPPTVLLTAISRLQADHVSGDCKYPDFTSEFLEKIKKENIKKKFSYQGESNDCLFRADYDHVGSGSTCVDCDRTQTVQRNPRDDTDPLVHYGNIASGNKVIKNGVVRDYWSKELGILCFEMEAAGLMQDFPCLVIRGICDYADSHKNKSWQEYAALTAAAFAKELLTVISPTRVVQEKPIRQIVSDPRLHALVSDTNTVISEHSRKQEVRYENEKHAECHRIFKTSRYQTFKDNNPERVQHTCKWVLEHPKYQRWHDSPIDDLLWISADPGCGKSVLARSLIDNELCSTQSHNVCYFFFKDNDDQDNLATAICALLHQLFSQQTFLTQHAMESYAQNGNSIRTEIGEMWRILLAAATDKQSNNTTCVLDALDECRKEDQQMIIHLLTMFYKRRKTTSTRCSRLKFLVTSRPYQNIESGFRDIPHHLPSIRLAGEERNADISKEINVVIKEKVAKIGRSLELSQEVQDSLQEKLLETKNRTYLWVHLVMEEVDSTWGGKRTKRALMKKVDLLPKSVEDAYERILSRHSRGQHREAKILLHIVVGAHRPLTLSEMDVAFQLATDSPNAQKHDDLDLDRDYLKSRIRELCGLFVFFRDERLYLIHQTAKEFLVKNLDTAPSQDQTWVHSLDGQVSNQIMAQICVQYLNFKDIPDGHFFPLDRRGRRSRRDSESRPFLDYSEIHWSRHICDSTIHDEGLMNLVYSLYQVTDSRFQTLTDMLWGKWMIQDRIHSGSDYALCLAASNGHNRVVQHLIDTHKEVSVSNGSWLGRTPLMWASFKGHEQTVHLLTKLGANPNYGRDEYGNPLQVAVAQGHSDIARFLVENGAKTDAMGGHYGTALIAASYRGDDEMTKFLINNGGDINAAGGRFGSALIAAACRGHINLVQYLTERGANINARGGHYESALIAACFGGYDKTILFLLKRGANVNTQGGEYGSAFQAATDRGYIDILELLADHGADINIRGWHASALEIASVRGHSEMVEYLIQKGAKIENKSSRYSITQYHHPLISASIRGSEDIVKTLLVHGADPSVHCNAYASCLQAAAHHGHEHIVRILLDHGADVNAQGGPYCTALIAAVVNYHHNIAEILIEKGADINIQGGAFFDDLGDRFVALCPVLQEFLSDHGARTTHANSRLLEDSLLRIERAPPEPEHLWHLTSKYQEFKAMYESALLRSDAELDVEEEALPVLPRDPL